MGVRACTEGIDIGVRRGDRWDENGEFIGWVELIDWGKCIYSEGLIKGMLPGQCLYALWGSWSHVVTCGHSRDVCFRCLLIVTVTDLWDRSVPRPDRGGGGGQSHGRTGGRGGGSGQ